MCVCVCFFRMKWSSIIMYLITHVYQYNERCWWHSTSFFEKRRKMEKWCEYATWDTHARYLKIMRKFMHIFKGSTYPKTREKSRIFFFFFVNDTHDKSSFQSRGNVIVSVISIHTITSLCVVTLSEKKKEEKMKITPCMYVRTFV